MADLNSTSDIKKQVLKNCGELQDGNSSYDQDGSVLSYINDAYLKVMAASNPYDVDVGEPWTWAKSKYPTILILKPAYETGTVALTNGSAAGTFGTAPGVLLGSFAGRYLKMDGRPDWIRILAHTAGDAAFTLDANYADDTGAALGFKAIQLDYDVGSSTAKILRIMGPCTTSRAQSGADNEGLISMLDEKRFNQDFPFQSVSQGVPSYFTIIYETDGVFTIRFNKFPSEETRVELNYIPIPSPLADKDTSIPLVPREHRCVLEYAATHRLMLDKEDDRASGYLQFAQAELRSMAAGKRKTDNQASGPYGRLIPRADLYGERKSNKFGR